MSRQRQHEYDLGDSVRLVGQFRNSVGEAVDPDAIYCKVKAPDGSVTTLTYNADAALVKDSAGNYHADVDADAAGRWYYRFYSTGGGKAAKEWTFTVRESSF